MADETNWVRGALPLAISPWLVIAGVVPAGLMDEPLLFGLGCIAGGLAIESARRATPGADSSDWLMVFSRGQFAGMGDLTAVRWCPRAALSGLAVLIAMFSFLVVMSVLSFLGGVDE
ncbi:MAG TPA: hypothetical protein PKN27_11065 [Propionibacteriaceae bacterium]|nr:hypothetical protein [Propionibacteriaceae bacterium]HPV81227.1 hypothetical protein [Dermatophilaceae bacterium]